MKNKVDEVKDFSKYLKKIHACEPAITFAKGKSWEECYNTCPRGDWMLWLFKKTNPDDLQLLTLAKGHCANTVRHLMKDERSIKAVDTAIAYGEGKATLEELTNAAAAAVDAAAAAVDAAYAAYVADTAAAAYAAAKIENQMQTANIVRSYIPINLWNVK